MAIIATTAAIILVNYGIFRALKYIKTHNPSLYKVMKPIGEALSEYSLSNRSKDELVAILSSLLNKLGITLIKSIIGAVTNAKKRRR